METAHTFLIAGLAIFLAWYTLKEEIPDAMPEVTAAEPHLPDSVPDAFSQQQDKGPDKVESKGIKRPPPDISPGGFQFNTADHVATLKNSMKDGATVLTGKLGMNFDLDREYKTQSCMFNPNPEDSTCIEWEDEAKLTIFKVR